MGRVTIHHRGWNSLTTCLLPTSNPTLDLWLYYYRLRLAGSNTRIFSSHCAEDMYKVFYDLKHALTTAPALSLPDYHQSFHLHEHEKDGYATGILVKKHGSPYQLVVYYSSRLLPVVLGVPGCLRSGLQLLTWLRNLLPLYWLITVVHVPHSVLWQQHIIQVTRPSFFRVPTYLWGTQLPWIQPLFFLCFMQILSMTAMLLLRQARCQGQSCCPTQYRILTWFSTLIVQLVDHLITNTLLVMQ